MTHFNFTNLFNKNELDLIHNFEWDKMRIGFGAVICMMHYCIQTAWSRSDGSDLKLLLFAVFNINHLSKMDGRDLKQRDISTAANPNPTRCVS
jgi:hypothetical protein